VAEWLGRALQKLLQQFESARDLTNFTQRRNDPGILIKKLRLCVVLLLRGLFMKYSTWIGILAALVLVVACFMPWAYYPDINKNFTGFFSEANAYGKPGKALIFFAVVVSILFVIPKIWAKRVNVFFCAATIAYCVKCFVLFTTCYNGICPEKKTGVFLILLASATMLLASLLPDLKLKGSQKSAE
jgi:hypothetical protein